MNLLTKQNLKLPGKIAGMGGINWEIGTDIYTLLYIKYTLYKLYILFIYTLYKIPIRTSCIVQGTLLHIL